MNVSSRVRFAPGEGFFSAIPGRGAAAPEGFLRPCFPSRRGRAETPGISENSPRERPVAWRARAAGGNETETFFPFPDRISRTPSRTSCQMSRSISVSCSLSDSILSARLLHWPGDRGKRVPTPDPWRGPATRRLPGEVRKNSIPRTPPRLPVPVRILREEEHGLSPYHRHRAPGRGEVLIAGQGRELLPGEAKGEGVLDERSLPGKQV